MSLISMIFPIPSYVENLRIKALTYNSYDPNDALGIVRGESGGDFVGRFSSIFNLNVIGLIY